MKLFKTLAIIGLIIVFIPAMGFAQDSCGTIEPVDNSIQHGGAVTNEGGDTVYIVENSGEVTVGLPENQNQNQEELANGKKEVEPIVEYGVSSDSWWTGVAILNPTDETQSGILKINSQYFNLTVPPAKPLTFQLSEWVRNKKSNQFCISLYAKNLDMTVIREQVK